MRFSIASYVGRDFGGFEYDITPEFVATYVAGTGDDNPWYRGDSPLGGPVAPALILYDAVYRTLEWYLPNIFGNLHARQEWELFAPVMVGERLTTRSVIVDRYVKRDREYVVNEVIVSNSVGADRVAQPHPSELPAARADDAGIRRRQVAREGFVALLQNRRARRRSDRLADAQDHRGDVHGFFRACAQLPQRSGRRRSNSAFRKSSCRGCCRYASSPR